MRPARLAITTISVAIFVSLEASSPRCGRCDDAPADSTLVTGQAAESDTTVRDTTVREATGIAPRIDGSGRVPSPGMLAALTLSIRDGDVRVWRGRDGFQITAPRFDSTGVGFEASDVEGLAYWDHGDKLHPEPPLAPIPWRDIRLVKGPTRYPARGAIVGLAAGAALGFALLSSNDDEMAGLIAIWFPPIGTVLGAAAGYATPGRKTIWP